MDSEEQKAPETKIPISFGEEAPDEQKPEQPVPAPEPAPGQPEEPVSPPEPSAEHPAEEAAPAAATEMPSLSEQPAVKSAQTSPEPAVQPETPAPEQSETTHQDTPEQAPAPATTPAPAAQKPKLPMAKVMVPVAVFVILLVAVPVILHLVAGHTKKKTAANTNQAVIAQPVLFTDPQTGFKIMRPAGWNNVKPAAGSGDAAEFQDPQADPINSTASYHPIITIADASSKGQTLAQVVSSVTTSLAKQTPGYKSLGTTQQTLPDGTPATLLTYSYSLSNPSPALTFSVTADEMIALKNNTGFILRGVALSSDWSKHQAVIESAFRGFQP